MATQAIITSHKSNVDCVNDRIEIFGYDVGPGGAPQRYDLMFDYSSPSLFQVRPSFGAQGVQGSYPLSLLFAANGETGITNEVLLAIVADRLEGFQRGKFACETNATALACVRSALESLKQRTKARKEQGVEGKMETHTEKASDASGAEEKLGIRIFIGKRLLNIHGRTVRVFDLTEVQTTWAIWSKIEAAVKTLEPLPTSEEWAVLESLASTPASKNGLAELKSALLRMS